MKKIIALILVLSMLMAQSCVFMPHKPEQGSGDQPSNPQSGPTEAEREAEEKKKQEEEAARLARIAEIEAILENPDLVLVNRDHRLPEDHEPEDLVPFGAGYRIDRECAEQLQKLMDAGKAAGYTYVLRSGYRSYSVQSEIYYNKVRYYKNRGYSEEEAIRMTNRYNAPPGASEHQTGFAVDVCIPSILEEYGELHTAYGETEEFEWFSAHAHEYGFIMRYKPGTEEITGYAYEPWHYRYVGVELAAEFHALDITYEEYIQGLQDELATLKSQ